MSGYRARSTPGPTTIADLKQLPDDGYRYDLVRGWLVREPPPGGEHGEIAAELIQALGNHVRAHRVGRVFTCDAGFVLAEDPPTVRGPDVAFVAAGRLPPGRAPRGYVPMAPDLAVEVVSQSNRWSDVIAKVRDYLEAGTRLVWVIDPPRSAVTVYRRSGIPEIVGREGVITGADVLPGFALAVAELFPD